MKDKLISHGLWVAVIQLPFMLLSDVVRYAFGPLPTQFCFLQVVFKNAVLSQSLLYLDAITVARYLLIFWTKNPASVNDDFWSSYITIWIYISSFAANYARYTHTSVTYTLKLREQIVLNQIELFGEDTLFG